MSTRQSLVSAVLAKLATITVANGYNTDVGPKIAKWRRVPFDEAELPAGILLDKSDEIISEKIGGGTTSKTDHRLEFHVFLFAKSGTTDDSVRAMIGDVYKAISADDTFGVSGVILSNPLGDEMEVVQEGVKVADAVVRFETVYRTNKWKET